MSSTREAVTAAFRFGLGARPDELKRIASDPRGFVLAALTNPAAARLDDSKLAPSHEIHRETQLAVRERRQARKAEAKSAVPAGPPPGEPKDPERPAAAGAGPPSGSASASVPGGMAETAPNPMNDPKAKAYADILNPNRMRRQAYREDAEARITRAQTTATPMLERLVMFWSNHFAVSATKGNVVGLVGAFEREAIRPHVLGKFSDMLLAVEQHPAMLLYLDNSASTGPNSRAGRNRKKGLNENLARETLELHTLGVNGGYTQEDVTNLARIITGWTVGNVNQPEAVTGRFFFARNRHEPGTWTVLGKSYRNGSRVTGEQCLLDLARHPATARHIASKLAAHFVSQTPPAELVARIETVFRDTDGDLAAVAYALVVSDAAWAAPPRKILPPYDFLIALSRAFAIEIPAQEVMRTAAALGQPMWRPPSPKGWPDDDDAWMAPSAIRERLRVAERAARLVAQQSVDPRDLAQRLLGERLGEPTRLAIARAEAREQGFELLMMSPEFQRR